MEAKESVVVSFKELVGEKAYDKITVSEICERAGVSRKSFYADFQDKEAIVCVQHTSSIAIPCCSGQSYMRYR